MMKLVFDHEKKKKLYSATIEAFNFCQELGVDQPEHKETDSVKNKAKEGQILMKLKDISGYKVQN